MTLACGPRVPPLTPVSLTKSRIQGTNEDGKILAIHAIYTHFVAQKKIQEFCFESQSSDPFLSCFLYSLELIPAQKGQINF